MCRPQVVVLNGCASLFSALATVLCEVGGKWITARSAVGAVPVPAVPPATCPQGLHQDAFGLNSLLAYRGLKSAARQDTQASAVPGDVSVVPEFWVVSVATLAFPHAHKWLSHPHIAACPKAGRKGGCALPVSVSSGGGNGDILPRGIPAELLMHLNAQN